MRHDIPEWMQHRWLRWTAIAVLLIGLAVLKWQGDGGMAW